MKPPMVTCLDELGAEDQHAYLGDGVYVTHDPYSLWLATEREDGIHYIAIEPSVLRGLLAYAERKGLVP